VNSDIRNPAVNSDIRNPAVNSDIRNPAVNSDIHAQAICCAVATALEGYWSEMVSAPCTRLPT
jgi:hypothetical protein